MNLLTKLVKDYEKYLEMAKTNCLKHRVDKQASYIEEREKLMVSVMRLLVRSTRMLIVKLRAFALCFVKKCTPYTPGNMHLIDRNYVIKTHNINYITVLFK